MACKCINDFNNLLKEKFNETATVNTEVLSNRVEAEMFYQETMKDL